MGKHSFLINDMKSHITRKLLQIVDTRPPKLQTPKSDEWRLAPGVWLTEHYTGVTEHTRNHLFIFSWVLRGRMLEWVKGDSKRPADGYMMNGHGATVTHCGYYRTPGEMQLEILPPPVRIELHRGPCVVLRIYGPRWRV